MANKWLISINPPAVGGRPEPTEVTRLHGPFESDPERSTEAARVAMALGYPDELVFAAFDVVDGIPELIYPSGDRMINID